MCKFITSNGIEYIHANYDDVVKQFKLSFYNCTINKVDLYYFSYREPDKHLLEYMQEHPEILDYKYIAKLSDEEEELIKPYL